MNQPSVPSPNQPSFSLPITFRWLAVVLLALWAVLQLTQILPELWLVFSAVALLTTLFGFLLDGLEALFHRMMPASIQRFSNIYRTLALIVLSLITAFVVLLSSLVWIPYWGGQFKELANSLPSYVRQIHTSWHRFSQAVEANPVLAPLQVTVKSSLQELQLEGNAAPDDVLGETVVVLATTPSTPESQTAAPDAPKAKPTTTPELDIDDMPYPPGFFQKILLGSVQQIATVVTASVSGLLATLLVAIMVIFSLLDPQLAQRSINRHTPETWQPTLKLGWHTTQALLTYTVIGQTITAGLTGMALYGLYSLLGVDYAQSLSLLFALCTLLPAIGAWFGAIPNCIVLLATGHGQGLIAVAIALLLIYAIKTMLWRPALRYEGTTLPLKLNPMVLVASFLMCWHWLGPMGMLAVTPLAAVMTGIGVMWKHTTAQQDSRQAS